MISIIAIDPGTWLDDLASAIVFIVFGIICLMAALDGDHKRWSTTVIIVATICETARIGLTGADELTPIVMFSGAFFVTLTRYKTSRIRSLVTLISVITLVAAPWIMRGVDTINRDNRTASIQKHLLGKFTEATQRQCYQDRERSIGYYVTLGRSREEIIRAIQNAVQTCANSVISQRSNSNSSSQWSSQSPSTDDDYVDDSDYMGPANENIGGGTEDDWYQDDSFTPYYDGRENIECPQDSWGYEPCG
jgi:hypothetical protein